MDAGLQLTTVPRWDEIVGHAQAIAVDPDGAARAGTDPRADGGARETSGRS
jgi:hypothetical protein